MEPILSVSLESNASTDDEFGVRIKDKREKYRLEIRKTSKKQMLAGRRKDLLGMLRNQFLQQLSELFKGFSQDETLQVLQNLETEVRSQEFNQRLLSMKLDGNLIQLMQQPGSSLDIRRGCINILKELAGYSQDQNISLVQPKVIDLLYSQIMRHSFANREQRDYLAAILCLISNLAGLKLNKGLYQHLVDIKLCDNVFHKLSKQDDVDIECLEEQGTLIVKYITRIRTSLIKNTFELNFVIDSLKNITELYSEYTNLCYKEYCRLLLAVLDYCPKQQLQQIDMFLSHEHTVFNFEDLFNSQLSSSQSSLFLQVLDQIEYHFDELVTYMLQFVPMNFFVNCWESQLDWLKHEGLKVFGNLIGSICSVYREEDETNKKIVEVVLRELENPYNIKACLVILEGLTKNAYWVKIVQMLLEQDLISKLAHTLNMQGLHLDCLLQTLQILLNILDYSKEKSEDRIKRSMHSVGIIRILEELQNHNNQKVYKNAMKVVLECQMIKSQLEQD